MILEVNQVDQVYRSGFWMTKTQVLHQVTFSVPPRTVFGFLGANGAGKTTLIQIIAGLRVPTAGEVKVAGYPATSPEARAQIGYLPERPYFYDHLTGEELLSYLGTLSGMLKVEIKSRITEVLKVVGMSAAREIQLKKYSKGMLQRIGIAQALLHNPEFLLLDEPMSGLDPVGRKEIRELIIQLAAEGRTIFFSTHIISDAEAICNQVALIKKGHLIGSGPLNKLLPGTFEKTEIIVAAISLEQAKTLGCFETVRETSEGVIGVVVHEKGVAEALPKLLACNAQIVSVSPIRPSLESFFEDHRN